MGHILVENLFREVLDTVVEAENASSLQELNAIFQPALRKVGFSLFAGLEVASPKAQFAVDIKFGAGFETWWAHYLQMKYAQDDVLIKECIRTHDAFFWSDVLARGHLSPKEKLIVAHAQTYELLEGFIAPLHKADGSIFAVLLAGRDCNSRDAYTRATAHLLSSYYGSLGRRLFYASRSDLHAAQPLTARQIECLKWARKGKSSRDIGDIGLLPVSWTPR